MFIHLAGYDKVVEVNSRFDPRVDGDMELLLKVHAGINNAAASLAALAGIPTISVQAMPKSYHRYGLFYSKRPVAYDLADKLQDISDNAVKLGFDVAAWRDDVKAELEAADLAAHGQ